MSGSVNKLPESTHLERMIMGAMQVVAPDVLQRCWDKCKDDKGGAQVPRKTLLLQELMDDRGPVTVLGLTEHIPEDTLSSSLLYLLINSSSPKELMEKVNRYDRYFHPDRRVVLVESGTDCVIVENASLVDDVPWPAEELFLCGALKCMLDRIGCEGVQVQWLCASSPDLRQILNGMEIPVAGLGAYTRWKFFWQKHVRNGHIAGLDAFLSRYMEPFNIPSKTNIIERVERILSIDLGTRPGMDVMAEMLGMSVRSFQRKMHEEGTTYTRLFSELRIKVASRMLRQSDGSVTEIGFLCGFRDSSHFSREFKKVQQVSPRRYRELFKDRR